MAGLEVKRRAYRRGLCGEWMAALALTCKGYRILARRYRTRNGEIDLIARRGRLVVMVEVKCRANLREAMDAVGLTAQRRIEAAAGQWLQKRPDCLNCAIRFDLVAILPWRWPIHVERAWEGS